MVGFDFSGGGGGPLLSGAGVGTDFIGSAGLAGGSFFGPLGAVAGQAAGSALGRAINPGGSASSAAISRSDPLRSDRTFINVAPVGVNVGEIFRNLEGPPENGGFGLTRRNRFLADDPGATLIGGSQPLGFEAGVSAGGNIPTTLILVVAGAGVLWFALRKR